MKTKLILGLLLIVFLVSGCIDTTKDCIRACAEYKYDCKLGSWDIYKIKECPNDNIDYVKKDCYEDCVIK